MSAHAIELFVITLAMAVGGYKYGIYSGRWIDWCLCIYVVFSAALLFALVAPRPAVALVSLVTIVAALVGCQSTYRFRPAFNPALTPLTFVVVGLFDLVFWGARLFGG